MKDYTKLIILCKFRELKERQEVKANEVTQAFQEQMEYLAKKVHGANAEQRVMRVRPVNAEGRAIAVRKATKVYPAWMRPVLWVQMASPCPDVDGDPQRYN